MLMVTTESKKNHTWYARPVFFVSNLQQALEALKTTGYDPNAPLWDKAIRFLQRCQKEKPWHWRRIGRLRAGPRLDTPARLEAAGSGSGDARRALDACEG